MDYASHTTLNGLALEANSPWHFGLPAMRDASSGRTAAAHACCMTDPQEGVRARLLAQRRHVAQVHVALQHRRVQRRAEVGARPPAARASSRATPSSYSAAHGRAQLGRRAQASQRRQPRAHCAHSQNAPAKSPPSCAPCARARGRRRTRCRARTAPIGGQAETA